MNQYDDFFDETAPTGCIFAEKGALDPFSEPDEVVARDEQASEIARILNGVHDGYLPTTVAVYGPPGTGKTLTTRQLCRAFASRTQAFAFEYVNLKECRTLFSAANEIHLELTGEKKGAYEGLDGVFEGIWAALEGYPEWPVLVLDEVDHVQQDSNYDPSEFFYRLLRGEGKLKRQLNLSVFLISNQLLDIDLRLDSRVRSAMSDEEVFFPPYSREELDEILSQPVARAFTEEALPDEVRTYGIEKAAQRWGDARKAFRLFRRAGETAVEYGLDAVTVDCIDVAFEGTNDAAVVDKLTRLPTQHIRVLTAITGTKSPDGEIVQPVTTDRVYKLYSLPTSADNRLSRRGLRGIIVDLETMGLVDTTIDSRGRNGRAKLIETTFEPQRVREALRTLKADSREEILAD